MNDLLKFITCGSVDDGKSTLIGHILYDAKLLYADQEKALLLDSKVGSTGGDIDYSLLLDGLMAEREQGITIDVAYRYFTTDNRSFIVADTPGHEEYTRNMAVGASFADLAVILIDATQGVLVQTRRHTRICDMMGIRHFVFAVNKMDLVDYDENVYNEIKKEIKALMTEFNYKSVRIIPVSATKGDNVTASSENMPWYKGDSMLTYLENVNVSASSDKKGFVLPVQRVCRPNFEFRGFQGEISCGRITVGDQVVVYPNREKANISEIYCGDKKVEFARRGAPVTVTLDKEIDVSRGSVIESDYDLFCGNSIRANVLCMDEEPLEVGKNFLLKLATQSAPCAITDILYKIDVNTGKKLECTTVEKNEIACCEISVDKALVFDLFKFNRDLGSLILIDRISHKTSACGVVIKNPTKNGNLFWQNTDITREIREKHLRQTAKTIWFTGLSGSGKSALGNALEKKLFLSGKHTMLLDGDNIRMGLNGNLSFSKEDRIENIRRIAEVAKLMNDAGLIVITCFISPFKYDRDRAKKIIGDAFSEVYVSTPIEECEKRDIKGLYKKARNGEIKDFTGINSPYEIPENPDAVIDTTGREIEDCVDEIIKTLGL